MKKIFGNWWVLTGLAVLFLVLVLCVGLPLFLRPLAPWYVRLPLFVAVAGTWGLIGFLRARKSRRAAAAIAAELTAPSAADAEGKAVAARMGEALATLKANSAGRRDYLYNRPWYVILGPPGAGKTTALLNSGLRFPLSDQSLKGVGGTRNLDFWFADEAVMVDTAGRYTTQDSDATADGQGWKSFLALLKRHRPLSPVNGLLVAIGVDELLGADRAGLDRHAAIVRRRLAEIRATLEVSTPVYLLVTKTDLIAGFSEFYDDLDVEGRRAVLGATFPVERTRPVVDDLVTAFDEVVANQQARQAKRLFEEVDQARRSLILGFPSQLGALRSRLARFVDGAFLSGDQPTGTLRGFYFTSGIQQGAPLDRILAGVANSLQASGESGRGGAGRTYFLNRLLTEVVFGEAGLVEADPAARRRQQTRLSAGLLAVVAAAVFVLALWGVSFWQNRSFQSALGQSSAQVATLLQQTGVDLVEVRDSDPDLEQALTSLRALRNLPQGYAEQAAGEPGLFKRFGLYQSSHADSAVEAYRGGLRRILLPRLLLRLEQYMAATGGDPMALYQPLKVYLMLGGQGPLDKGAVSSWIAADWTREQFPGADRAPLRNELEAHLAALLEDDGMASDWPGRKAPLDGTTIESARAALQTLSLGDRAYAVLRQKALSGEEQPWRAAAEISAGDARAFANGQEVMQLEVPYFYTREGYQKSYLLGLATVVDDFRKDLWVLGEGAQTAGVQMQVEQIRPGVATLYAREYIAAWDRVASLPQPGNYFADPAALGAFAKTPSPLKTLLAGLRRNTTFAGGAGSVSKMATARVEASRFGRLAAAAGATAGPSVDAAAEIANHFKPLHDYVGDGKTPAPIDEFVAAVRKAGEAIASAKRAGGGMGAEAVQSQVAMAMGSVETSAGGAPPQLQNFVAGATSGGAAASTSAAQGALNDAWTGSVMPDCQLATQDRYPFVGTAQADAVLADVQRVFGLGGTLDGFVQQRVVPLLDMSGPIWRWNAQSPQAATLNPKTPEEFVKARQLRDMLASGLTVQIEAKAFGAGVDAAELVVGNTRYTFERSSVGASKPIQWSVQGNLPVASVTLMTAGQKVGGVETQGPWALFRLLDAASKENAGPMTVLATFGSGSQTAVFKISLPNDRNPLGRGGLWSFRCPVAL